MSIYDEVFAALDDAGVRYVVVGGVAVVLQGHPRMTVDLDLVVELTPEGARAAVEALLALGLQSRLPVDPFTFADEQVRRDWIENRNLQVFSLYDPENPMREVDLFASYPLPFEDLVRDAQSKLVGALQVPVASVQHLVTMKKAAGRPQDLEDVAALQALQEEGS